MPVSVYIALRRLELQFTASFGTFFYRVGYVVPLVTRQAALLRTPHIPV
jgi:hypothetical protein